METYITNDAVDLYAGTTLDGNTILTDVSTLAPDWNNLTSIPSDLEDGDDDTLATLGCSDGELASYNATSGVWECYSTSSSGSSVSKESDSFSLSDGYYDFVTNSADIGLIVQIWYTDLDGNLIVVPFGNLSNSKFGNASDGSLATGQSTTYSLSGNTYQYPQFGIPFYLTVNVIDDVLIIKSSSAVVIDGTLDLSGGDASGSGSSGVIGSGIAGGYNGASGGKVNGSIGGGPGGGTAGRGCTHGATDSGSNASFELLGATLLYVLENPTLLNGGSGGGGGCCWSLANDNDCGGEGGGGAGSVYIAAPSITINSGGSILATGGNGSGNGGDGSGGGVWLVSPEVTIDGTIDVGNGALRIDSPSIQGTSSPSYDTGPYNFNSEIFYTQPTSGTVRLYNRLPYTFDFKAKVIY